MVARKDLAQLLCEWVGTDRIELVDPASGWPSHFICQTDSGPVRLAAHLGIIVQSMRNREEVERRFQNPGQNRPVSALDGEFPILLGINELNGERVLVGMDAQRRLGRPTRQSFFMPLALLTGAIALGWDEHLSETGERIIAFAPPLLPLFVDAYRAQRPVSDAEVQAALAGAGARLAPRSVFAAATGMALLDRSAEERIETALKDKATLLDLSGLGLTEVPLSLIECTQLQTLNLSTNSLTDLPDFLGHFARLKLLDVSGNELTHLPDFISQLGGLESLDVSDNPLTRLPDFLSQLTQLQSLNVSRTELTRLPESLGRLTQLRRFLAYDNGLERLPEWLLRLTSLEVLSVSSNRIRELPEGIQSLQSLVSLCVADNQLTRIPDSLCKLTRLESLRVDPFRYTVRTLGLTLDWEPPPLRSSCFAHWFHRSAVSRGCGRSASG